MVEDKEMYLEALIGFVVPTCTVDRKAKVINVPSDSFELGEKHPLYPELMELKSFGFTIQSVIV